MGRLELQRAWRALGGQGSPADASPFVWAGLGTLAAAHGLPGAVDVPCSPPPDRRAVEAELAAAPAFKNVSMALLRYLVASRWRPEEDQLAAPWPEKLMRFCEVRLADLRREARKKWGGEAHDGLTWLALLFVEQHARSQDLRYLNTALKLVDLGAGLRRTGSLRADREADVAAFRLELRIELALTALRGTPWPA